MAALTWRDVSGPDFRGVQTGINSAADLLAKSTTGLSGALTQFGDQQTLQQLAQYSDAQKLQADIQYGRFNTANASPEALATIMGRPASLIENQTNQQQAAYRKDLNPLLLANQGTQNDQASYDLYQDRDAQTHLEKVTRPNAKTDRERADGVWVRNEKTRELLDTAQVDVNKRLTDGSLSTVNQARDLLKSVSGGPKEVTALYTQALSSRFPELTAAPIAPPLASGIGSFGSVQVPGTSVGTVPGVAGTASTGLSFDPVALGNAIYGQESSSGKADTTKVNSQSVTGPMQIQQATFEGLKKNGVIPATADWNNPADNKAAGFAHIADLAKKYKTPEQVAAVYYSGPAAVNADGTINRDRRNPERPNDPTVGQYIDQVIGRVPTIQQLSNSAASSATLNNMAKLSANTPEVERWQAATATPGNGSLADVANELKKGSLATVPMNRIQEMLAQVASATKTTSDYRLAGELLKSSLSGDSTFRFGFGTDTFGFNPDFNDKLLKENIDKYNKRSTTTDAIQAGRSLDQGTAALAETQKQVEALKAYRDAKKIELAKGVYGVTQDDVTKADVALNQASSTAQQIQLQIDSFRPKTESETTPPAAKSTKDAPTNVSAPIAASLIAAADKVKAPLRSTDGGKTWSLDIDKTIRNPSVSYYQPIENPVYTKLKGKTFKSRAEAEKAYRDALKS
jgi:hypothetical protein